MYITEDIVYVGVNDREIDLFEGQYKVPDGMAYNSYVINDQKTAVMDTVDAGFIDEWLANLEVALGKKSPDYLIVSHMEPDHSAGIAKFASKYPEAKLVGNAMTFTMMKRFYDTDYPDRKVVVKDGDTLSLGDRELKFVFAPMVHWPEVMMTYDPKDRVFFSADAFGKFGALDAGGDWACEARRYYFGIVGKFGVQVQGLLKKAAALDIRTICPLHGPVLKDDLGYYLGLYDTWSSYKPEGEGVFIAYTSVYGNTKKAVGLLAGELERQGCPKVAIADLARGDMAEAVEDAFRYGKIVLATTTYNGDIFPVMREFINELMERGYRNRTIGIMENGTWAPMAAKVIKARFENSRDIVFADNTVTINAALDEKASVQISALAAELA